jgi:hypothetical protein
MYKTQHFDHALHDHTQLFWIKIASEVAVNYKGEKPQFWKNIWSTDPINSFLLPRLFELSSQ